MHACIERDIENKEFKTMFDYELQKGMEKSGENIKWRSNECKESFIEEIKKDIEQFEERLKDSFDEEADIEDEQDYNKRFKIKKENVQNRLNDLISLSEKEKEGLIIVACRCKPL